MSLVTDLVFVQALRADQSLMQLLAAGDVYSTSIPLPDEDMDNAPLPYIIVTYDGMTNDGSTKDGYEGDSDRVKVSIEIAAPNREHLGLLAEAVRKSVRSWFEEHDGRYTTPDLSGLPSVMCEIEDYAFSAGPVSYDPAKPCFYQTLSYDCDNNAES